VSSDGRRPPRKRAHLKVAYRTAREFVTQYAEYLSVGGMFVKDATGLALHDEVTVEVELPGHGTFMLVAEVMRVVGQHDPGLLAAGVGLQIRPGTAGFATAVEAYLACLGHRKNTRVLVELEPWRQRISDAGYQVLPLTPPTRLVTLLDGSGPIGIVVPDELAAAYASELAFLGETRSTVVPVHPKLPLAPLLAWLDDKLLPK
jgi:Tfp pilus assembly protein PilZ